MKFWDWVNVGHFREKVLQMWDILRLAFVADVSLLDLCLPVGRGGNLSIIFFTDPVSELYGQRVYFFTMDKIRMCKNCMEISRHRNKFLNCNSNFSLLVIMFVNTSGSFVVLISKDITQISVMEYNYYHVTNDHYSLSSCYLINIEKMYVLR
jgi:hypothetical protein